MIDTKAIRAAAEADIGCPREYLEVPISEIQSSTVIALLDRLEAAEKDAARYRAIAADPYFDGYAWWTQDICIIESDDQNKPPTKAQVDAAIDTAMKEHK